MRKAQWLSLMKLANQGKSDHALDESLSHVYVRREFNIIVRRWNKRVVFAHRRQMDQISALHTLFHNVNSNHWERVWFKRSLSWHLFTPHHSVQEDFANKPVKLTKRWSIAIVSSVMRQCLSGIANWKIWWYLHRSDYLFAVVHWRPFTYNLVRIRKARKSHLPP